MKTNKCPVPPTRHRTRDSLRTMVVLLLASVFAVAASATATLFQITSPSSSYPVLAYGQAGMPTYNSRSFRVPGQPPIDSNTLALYHFDTASASAIDATGRYTGTLRGNAWISNSGLYAGVLNTDGNRSFVQVGNLGDPQFVSQGTIDMYIDFVPQCDRTNAIFPIFSIANEYDGTQPVAMLRVDGYLNFMVLTPSGWQTAVSGINPCRYLVEDWMAADNLAASTGGALPALWPYDATRFHHVAGTWGPRGVEIWVDGVLHGVGVDKVTPVVIPDIQNYASVHNYWCNPQDQIRSSDYPYCSTPVPGVVPGRGHSGGILPYRAILIGCDTGGTCFNGRIDEVRISNVQRSFQTSVLPTLTPLPTQTPVPLTNAFAVDARTLALYRLEEAPYRQIADEVGYHNGYLSGNADVDPDGHFGKALILDGGVDSVGYRSYAHLGNVGAPLDGTIETWVKLSDATAPSTILHAGDDVGKGWGILFLGVQQDRDTISFGLDDGTMMRWVDSQIPARRLLGCWHPIAATWGRNGMQVWVDGVLAGSNSFTGAPIDRITTYNIGCNALGYCMKGKADEVRISNVQRTYGYGTGGMSRASSSGITVPPDSILSFLPAIQPKPPCLF